MGKPSSELIKGESGEYFLDFLDNLRSDETADMYLSHFENFLRWLDMDCVELYERHRDNLKSDEPIKKMWLGKKVNDYMKYMRDELGYSTEDDEGEVVATGTVLVIQKAVGGFFRSVGIESIPKNGTVETLIRELPTIDKDPLREVLAASGSYKTQAFIHAAKDTGLRVGDITRLRIGQLRKAIEDESIDYYTITITQQKTRRKADPVFGPECLNAIRKWMRYRTEKLGLSAEDGDPLFCIERTRSAYTTKGGKEVRGTTAGDFMDESNMGVIFGQLVRKANIPKDINGKRPSIHSLRKYNKTGLEYGGCPTSWINKMQGRKGEGTGGRYTKPNTEQLIDIYSKAYDKLRISEPKVKALEARIAELEKFIRADLERYKVRES